jgi:single-strand DNA-binding protein
LLLNHPLKESIMASVNKVTLVGNCGRDPEVRYLPSGQAVANISVATTSRRKDKNSGETIEDTQWHRVVFYDRLAEIAGEYVKKGRPVYIEGRLKYGSYVDKTTGVEKSTCDIVATELQLLGGRESSGGDNGSNAGGNAGGQAYAPRQAAAQQRSPQQAPAAGQGYQQGYAPPQAQQPAAPRAAGGAGGFDDMDDDIPFADPLKRRAFALAI